MSDELERARLAQHVDPPKPDPEAMRNVAHDPTYLDHVGMQNAAARDEANTHWVYAGKSLCGLDAATGSPDQRFLAIDVPKAEQLAGWRVGCPECLRRLMPSDDRRYVYFVPFGAEPSEPLRFPA